MNYTLFFPTAWDEVDPENDNIDICMNFPDGRSYTFVAATTENVKMLIRQDGKPYLSPASPMLIVEKLTKEIIVQLMAEIAQDERLLKYYGSDL